jgi:hypothetical protein
VTESIPGVHEETLEGHDVAPCHKCYLHTSEHELVEHLWRAEVIVGGEHRWAGNNLTFATEDEAKAYVLDLAMRWTSVVDFRAVSVYTPEHEEYVKP